MPALTAVSTIASKSEAPAISPTLPDMITDGGVEFLKERDTRPARSEMKHDEHKILRGVYPVLQIARHQGTGEAGWEVVSAL